MKRTGNSKIAVVGWGRGMGHQGHMYLADAVITQAINMKADPYFFVSKTIGKDDPVFPEEKVRIYQKVFPQYANIFEPQGNLNGALTHLADLGYQGVVVVVGADQKKAFQYLEGPNKEGVPVYQTMGLKKLKVISRQETNSKFAHEEGPRATPMREILLDPNASEEDKFKVWRRDMPEQLGDREVLDIMNKAESRLVHSNKPKVDKVQAMSKKAAKLKEAIMSFKVKKPAEQQPEKEPTLGYKHLFKQPGEEPKPIEKHYRGWEEYEKEHNPDEVEEGRIIDANAKVNLYYVTPKGARQKVFQSIPHRMIDKAIMVLRSKYPQIKDTDIEMRPADHTEYTREDQMNEFVSSDDGRDDRPKFLPWNEFIGDLKAILDDHFYVQEKVIKSTIQARFIPHDPMEFGPTMLYSYYEARAGRNKGAISTRGSIQVGKYYPNTTGLGDRNFITHFSLLKGTPFERHFDLTGENVQKIADIIIGNTQGAYQMPTQVNEFAPDDNGDSGQEDMFFKYAKMWYNGNDAVKQRVEEILAQAGWEIGPLESEEGGAFIVQSGDEDGDSYMGWSQEELQGLNEFALGNGDDGLPYAEYQVYQCNPEDQFDWIGGPLYQTDNMGMAHKYAYEKYIKHRPKAFMIWQERSQGSRGNYGVKGQSDGSEDIQESGISRRGILKGIAGAAAAGAAGKASAIAGAFPTPSHQQAMYAAAAQSNRAQAAELQRQNNAARAAKLDAATKDIERLNKINFHGGKVTPTNASWDGDSDFLDMDGTKYNMASRMPITGDEPSDMKLISTREGRQVYIWTRKSLKGTHGRYFYPAPAGSSQIKEFAIDKSDNGDGRSKLIGSIMQLLQSGKKVDFYVPGIRGHVVGSGGNGDWLTLKRWNKPHSKINYSLSLDSSDDNRFVLKMVKPDYYQVVEKNDLNEDYVDEK